MISLPVTMANQKSAKNRTRQTMIVIPAQAGRWPKVDGAGARITLLTRRGPHAFPYEDPTCLPRPLNRSALAHSREPQRASAITLAMVTAAAEGASSVNLIELKPAERHHAVGRGHARLA